MPLISNLHGRGGVVPAGAVFGGRLYRGPWRLPASKWRNGYKIGRDGSRDEVIAQYRDWLQRQPELMAALSELRGKDLACWCAPKRCHAEVLRELANA
jgi:hypothetical protein